MPCAGLVHLGGHPRLPDAGVDAKSPVCRPSVSDGLCRLVTRYWSHGCFLADGQILAGMKRLAGIPATMIHGRYDVSARWPPPLNSSRNLNRFRWSIP